MKQKGMKILMTGMVLQLQVMNLEETNSNMNQFILYRVWTMLIMNNFSKSQLIQLYLAVVPNAFTLILMM